MILPHSSQTKLGQSVASSQLHKCRNSNQQHLLLKLPSSLPSLRQKYPNFSSPAILQHALLIQSPHTFFKQSLLHSYQHIFNTSQLTGTFPTAFKQAQVTPLLKKPTLNTSHTDSYRPVSLLPFIAKRLNELFSNSYPHFCQSITYWMLTNQVSDVDIQLRLRYSWSLKPCELQKLIPNHQFSFCWIYLLLLTLLTIRSY